MKIGDRIRQLRTSHFLTQHELAKKIDIAQSTLAMYERNKRIPSADVLNNLSAALNVSLDYLVRGDETPTKKEDQPSQKTADLADDDVLFTYQGKPLSEEDKAIIKRLMNGKQS